MAVSRSKKIRSISKDNIPQQRETTIPYPVQNLQNSEGQSVAKATAPLPMIDEEQFGSTLRELLKEPVNVEATRIPASFLADLTLKTLYYGGMMRGGEISQAVHLNFNGIVDPILRGLKANRFVEVTGGESLNPASYQYVMTQKGSEQARELLSRNRYVGPCPVNLQVYTEVVQRQARRREMVREREVRQAMSGLVLSDEIIERIGPAVNSHESLFLYGPPGNGKTTITKAIGRGLLPGQVMIPHSIYESGQIVKVYDLELHQQLDRQTIPLKSLDKRWVPCRLPIVITGGELTLSDLDLSWSETTRFYEAPLQLKANGGMFIIDDFGRQQMPPADLLNRWIVPLEERMDFLTFHTGKKFAIPFETLVVFSTNLDPGSLVDEAFLRRISHKLGVINPTEEQFRQIFSIVCKNQGIRFNPEAFDHLVSHYYEVRPMRACHPRDLLKHIVDYAIYREEQPVMSIELINRAARSYFGDLF